MKTLTRTMVAAALLGGSAVAQAELSANVAAASNYMFRGVTQTDDGAAVSGGLDWNHDSGFYLGTWMSNVDFAAAEVDFYGGYSGEAQVGDGLGYDISALYYHYPNADSGTGPGGKDATEIDYAEIGGSLSYGLVSGGIAYTVWGETDDGAFDDGDIYYYANLDLPFNLPDGFAANVFGGYYDFDDADSYGHWGASVSKDVGELGSVSVNYEQADGDEDDDVATEDSAYFWVGWSKDF